MRNPDVSGGRRYLFAPLVICWLPSFCPSGLQAQAPTITRQPQSVNIAAGMNATFSAQASSTLPLQWQWQLNENPVTNATSFTLTVTNAQSVNAGEYRVVASNSSG